MDKADAILNQIFLKETISKLPQQDRTFLLGHLTGEPTNLPASYIRVKLKQVAHQLAILGGVQRACSTCGDAKQVKDFAYDRDDCLTCEPTYARYGRNQDRKWMEAVDAGTCWTCSDCGESKSAEDYTIRLRTRCKECLRRANSKGREAPDESTPEEKEPEEQAPRRQRRKQSRRREISKDEQKRLSAFLARLNEERRRRAQSRANSKSKKKASSRKAKGNPPKRTPNRERRKATRAKPKQPQSLVCGSVAKYRKGCRCPACREANAELSRKYYKPRPRKKAEAPETEKKPRVLQPCGTRAAYRRGCRCEDCKEAARAHQRLKYKRRREREGKEVMRHGSKRAKAEHGTRSMYVNEHCRCDPCKDADRAYLIEYRARKRREKNTDCDSSTQEET